MINGYDVSRYQAVQFPTSGIDFAFTKATQGTTYVNPSMTGQAAWSRAHDLVTGFYHFLEKGSINAQASYFVTHADSQAGDVFACDWETNPATKTYATSAEKDAFIKEVQRLRPGHRVLLYCNKDFWFNKDKTGFVGDGLWIATAGLPAGSPGISDPWLLHQYSTANSIDHDIAKFATRADMRTWAEDGIAEMTDAEIAKVVAAVTPAVVKAVVEALPKAVWSWDGITAPADAPDRLTNPTNQPQTFLKADHALLFEAVTLLRTLDPASVAAAFRAVVDGTTIVLKAE
jgi:hypothetical protein